MRLKPGRTSPRWRATRFAEHRPFLVALALAALLRVVVQVAFPPAFVVSDGPTYLRLVDVFAPSPDRTVGYGVLLRALAWVTRDVAAVAIAQHLMGLLIAVLLYVLLLRWEVRPVVAMLATLPVLFDRMQLVLEHSALSDVLFELLVVLAVVVLGWRRSPALPGAALAGLLLGLAVLVRVVGQPMVLAGILFCLMAATGLRVKLATSAVLCVTFLLPLAGYAVWYHQENGAWALTQASGRALYMRTTAFVDCTRLEVPTYQEDLCPDEPLGERRDPTYYGWHDPNGSHALTPPAGTTPDEAMREFAVEAISTQPGDYAGVVARDFVSAFAPVRANYFEYDTHYKWNFLYYVDYESSDWTGPAFAEHGGAQPDTRQPWASFLAGYGLVVYVWGPLLLAMLAVALRGLAVRRSAAPEARPLIVLVMALGIGLTLAPDATAQFTWRYQLPMILLLPVAAALAWTRLRPSPPSVAQVGVQPGVQPVAQAGREATPSTD